jgi:hypothetical protein
MRTATTIAQTTIRIAFWIMLALGIIIWIGNDAVKPFHIAVGVVLVLALWTLAFIAMRVGVDRRLVAMAFVWGVIMPVFGLTQENLVEGDAHVVIQVLHVLVGMAAVAQAEVLAARIKRSGVLELQQG